QALARLLSGHQVDATAGSVAVDPADLRRAWGTLRPKYPADFSPSPAVAQARTLAEAWAHIKSGDGYYDRKDWAKAAAEYTKAIQLDPGNAEAWWSRGFAHDALQQWGQSVADYSKALQLLPENYGWLNHRGAAYYRLGQWEKALSDFSKALRLNPNDAEAWAGRGSLYAGQ